MSYDYDGD